MKTKESHLKKLNFWVVALLLILILTLAYGSMAFSQTVSSKSTSVDTGKYETIYGKILDSNTHKPLVFANVVLHNTNIGTVTNSDGDFLIKIPMDSYAGELLISHIGYRNLLLPIEGLSKDECSIELIAATIPIETVTISYGDPRELLLRAIDNIPDNYSTDPVMMKAFYRETIK